MTAVPKGKKTKRIRVTKRKVKAHLNFVAQQPCCVCGRSPVVVHHLMERFDDKIGRRDDKYVIPICPESHNDAQGVHGPETEIGFLSKRGVVGKDIALKLWRTNHE